MSDAEQEQSGNGDAELEDDLDDQVPADAGGEKEGAGEDESEASADSSDVSETPSHPSPLRVLMCRCLMKITQSRALCLDRIYQHSVNSPPACDL